MVARYEVDYSEIATLEKNIMQLAGRAEEVVNAVLHVDGVRIVKEHITELLPVSNIHKNHAKDSVWATSDTSNLEFTVKSKGGAAKNKGSFGYLVFPDEGRGASNPYEQEFMQRGLDAATPVIIERLHQKMSLLLQEVL